MMRSLCLVAAAFLVTAQAPSKPARPAAPSINVRTAGDLAAACSLKPASKQEFAILNFCNGFAQGVLQTNQQSEAPTKICFPNPAPKRSATMVEFSRWVAADTATRKSELASTGFLKFMSGRFPCS